MSMDMKAAEHINALASLSLEVEREKDSSLKHYASQLLTCVTILSVAYLTPASFIYSKFGGTGDATHGQRVTVFVLMIMLLLLIAALLLSLLALILSKTEVIDSPDVQYENFTSLHQNAKENGECPTFFNLSKNYCKALEIQYQALSKKHKRMWALLKAATIMVVLSVLIAASSIVMLFISIL